MPSAFDASLTVAVLVATALVVFALIAWFKEHRDGWQGLIEVAVILLVPVIGALAFLVSRGWSVATSKSYPTHRPAC